MTQQPLSDERRPANDGPKAAARNRAALVRAAREIYAEHGLDAPLSAIARRAGVGQGVLYRHFPDRAAVAIAVLEENVRQIERAAAADGADIARVLGVLTWHQTESAAFVRVLHADGPGGRTDAPAYARALSRRVELALRGHLPDAHPLAGRAEDLMIAVGMVSGAVTGTTREQRERRALAAWRLLGVEVGPVRPFDG
ncbi:helix-turn-helix domain-containing protein [Streptomyces capillispiralis]|uniref:TetR family transcriptional regulator n=1 Tax=Streptomyces capillispiralis TaxID=68182 RepID=A0A561TQI8_9ACTN|nr:helix-turn-helix domain-containing protein [Streptomyces capillispiralis]TWF89370.1 TetR family transcriptional regulator [Streptomyces capillispiralis]GHH93658.1 TetR family transcriptional regulator [Streptomyces capillispiralis]